MNENCFYKQQVEITPTDKVDLNLSKISYFEQKFQSVQQAM